MLVLGLGSDVCECEFDQYWLVMWQLYAAKICSYTQGMNLIKEVRKSCHRDASVLEALTL